MIRAPALTGERGGPLLGARRPRRTQDVHRAALSRAASRRTRSRRARAWQHPVKTAAPVMLPTLERAAPGAPFGRTTAREPVREIDVQEFEGYRGDQRRECPRRALSPGRMHSASRMHWPFHPHPIGQWTRSGVQTSIVSSSGSGGGSGHDTGSEASPSGSLVASKSRSALRRARSPDDGRWTRARRAPGRSSVGRLSSHRASWPGASRAIPRVRETRTFFTTSSGAPGWGAKRASRSAHRPTSGERRREEALFDTRETKSLRRAVRKPGAAGRPAGSRPGL